GACQLITGVACMPVPLSAMLCAAYPGAAAFRLLSVKTKEPLIAPVAVGAKLMGNLQEAPAARVPGCEEPLPTIGHTASPLLLSVKFAAILGLLPVEGIGKIIAALPMFASPTFRGLSVLNEPTEVGAKTRLGGSTKSIFDINLPVVSEIYTLPPPSN